MLKICSPQGSAMPSRAASLWNVLLATLVTISISILLGLILLLVLITTSSLSFRRLSWLEQGVTHILVCLVHKHLWITFEWLYVYIRGHRRQNSTLEFQSLRVTAFTSWAKHYLLVSVWKTGLEPANHHELNLSQLNQKDTIADGIHPLLPGSITQTSVINRMMVLPIDFNRFERLQFYLGFCTVKKNLWSDLPRLFLS